VPGMHCSAFGSPLSAFEHTPHSELRTPHFPPLHFPRSAISRPDETAPIWKRGAREPRGATSQFPFVAGRAAGRGGGGGRAGGRGGGEGGGGGGGRGRAGGGAGGCSRSRGGGPSGRILLLGEVPAGGTIRRRPAAPIDRYGRRAISESVLERLSARS